MILSQISSICGEVDWSARAALLRVIYLSFNFTYLLYSGGSTPRGQPPQASTVHVRQSITFNLTDTPKPSAERFMNQVFRLSHDGVCVLVWHCVCVCDTVCACVTLWMHVSVSNCRVWWFELTWNAFVCIFLSARPLAPTCLLIFILLLYSVLLLLLLPVLVLRLRHYDFLHLGAKKSNSSHIWPSLIQT